MTKTNGSAPGAEAVQFREEAIENHLVAAEAVQTKIITGAIETMIEKIEISTIGSMITALEVVLGVGAEEEVEVAAASVIEAIEAMATDIPKIGKIRRMIMKTLLSLGKTQTAVAATITLRVALIVVITTVGEVATVILI